MSDQVGNPEDRFSQNEAHILNYCTNSQIQKNEFLFSIMVKIKIILNFRDYILSV